MDVHGNVGDVGGVAEKTVAVQRAGAKYFFVPQVEVATAKGAAGPGLTIVGVTTLAQALRDLRALGGRGSGAPYAAPLSHFPRVCNAVVWKEWTIAEFSQLRVNRRPKSPE